MRFEIGFAAMGVGVRCRARVHCGLTLGEYPNGNQRQPLTRIMVRSG
ncbi:hypothetical protein DV517_65160 [Streptomyces sp. S816]|nr:hypothetical protein DV517_65160 [Streptomyces sp. S816]